LAISEAMNLIHDSADPEANIIFGAVIDERLSGAIKITVIATNFGAAAALADSTQNSALLRATGTTDAMPGTDNAEVQIDFDRPAFMRKSVN
jgi:cell division protein FtsZ